MFRALLLVAALLARGAVSDPGDLRERGCDFPCADGTCAVECDGRAECSDAADERGTRCQAGALRLAPGGEARVAVADYSAARHGALRVMLCDNSQCSVAELRGRVASGGLAADTGLDCNRMGHYCRLRSQAEGDVTPFEDGAVELTVRRGARYLELWMEDDSVRVPIKKSYARLLVRAAGPDKALDISVTPLEGSTEQPTQSTAAADKSVPSEESPVDVHGP